MLNRGVGVLLLVAGVVLAGFQAPAFGTTMKVNTVDDEIATDDDCSLREAVEASRLNEKVSGCPKGQAKPDTIVLKAKDYNLGFSTTNEDSNANGDLDVTYGGRVAVKGAGRTQTEIRQNAGDRVFDVTLAAGDLKLRDLSVTAGDVTGLSTAQARGGNLRVSNGGKLSLDHVGVNSADAFVGGGLYASGTSTLIVKSSLFDSNDATDGGGIASMNTARATIKKTSFLGNDAFSDSNDAEGGAIYNTSTAGLTIVDSSIQGSGAGTNGAGNFTAGGGIRTSGAMTLRRSVVSGNSTSSDVDNLAEHGGGVYVSGGDVTIVNSTIYDNDAGLAGDNDGMGGGLYVNSGNVNVKFTTLGANNATDEGDSIGSFPVVHMTGSILDSETDPCAGSIASDGFNVTEFDDPDCLFLDSDVTQPDSIDFTGGLQDNGGPTDTIAIAKTSLARNLVPKSKCKSAKHEDQRGFKRPKGTRCDAGAFEFGAKP